LGVQGILYYPDGWETPFLVRQDQTLFSQTTNYPASIDTPSLIRGVRPRHYKCVSIFGEGEFGLQYVNVVISTILNSINNPIYFEGHPYLIYRYVPENHRGARNYKPPT
jgi:hypothetical protein